MFTCEITDQDNSATCEDNSGGVVKSLVAKLADITGVTITAGVITGLTMASTGLWKEWKYDRDNTARYDQPGTNQNGRFSTEQTHFCKFKGVSAASIDAANKVRHCCDVVAIHIWANGLKTVQGLEMMAATGAPVPTANRNTRVTPSVLSDVSANENRTEYTIAGNANSFSMTTSMTDTAILAL